MARRRTRSAEVAAAAAVISGALVALAGAAADETVLVSRSTGGAKGNGASNGPRLSADGRLVVFESTADNLEPDDPDTTSDVYVRDLQSGTTALVSRASDDPFADTRDGAGRAAGVKANGSSTSPSISADGRFVAFSSTASNLDPDDPDTVQDIFVRDLQSGTTTLVSRATGAAGAKGTAASTGPTISGDGRLVSFTSSATLDSADGDVFTDVYVRDLQAETTTLASRATGGAKGNLGGGVSSISGNGRFVAFLSASNNLDAGDADTTPDVYVRDLVDLTTTLASRASSGVKSNGAAGYLSISADGLVVAFEAVATNLDLADPDTASDIFVRDLQTATTVLASRASGVAGAKGNANSLRPVLSADGRLVAYHSAATTLDPDDTDAVFDVFVRDLQASTTRLASRGAGAAGAKGDGTSVSAALTDQGAVAFASQAANLHPDDTDTGFDVFLRGPAGEPVEPTPEPTATPAPTVTAAATATATPVPTPPPTGPQPKLGETEVVEPVSGVVRVRLRGKRRFVRIQEASAIPDRSEIDTTRGVLRLTVARRDGTTGSAEVSEGRAIVDQSVAAPPTTTLRLSAPLACVRDSRASAAKRKRNRKRRRMLFLQTDGGTFKTRGGYAAGTASGTAWRTTDRCAATRIDVREGTVSVRDVVKRRTIRVRAPGSYTARSKMVAGRPLRVNGLGLEQRAEFGERSGVLRERTAVDGAATPGSDCRGRGSHASWSASRRRSARGSL